MQNQSGKKEHKMGFCFEEKMQILQKSTQTAPRVYPWL